MDINKITEQDVIYSNLTGKKYLIELEIEYLKNQRNKLNRQISTLKKATLGGK